MNQQLSGYGRVMFRLLIVVGLMVAVLGSSIPPAMAGPSAQTATYTITGLGTLGGCCSSGTGINDFGQVVGHSTLAGGASRAFLWQDAVMTNLGTLPGYSLGSSASAINASSQVVGTSQSSVSIRAVLWDGGETLDVGSLGGQSFADGINDVGHVIGNSRAGSLPYFHAFLWRDGVMMDIGPPGVNTYATSINDGGQIVGQLHPGGSGRPYALLWQEGVMTNLNTLIPPGSGWELSRAEGINISGQIVGSGHYQGASRLFLWDHGEVFALALPPGYTSGSVRAISELGRIVGSAAGPGGSRRAMLWQHDVPIDLNGVLPPGSGWELRAAHGINSRGQIVGDGVYSGQNRGFLLTPPAER